MLLTLGVGNAWARTYAGEEILYVKNIKPTNWNDAWVVSSGTVWAVFDGASGTNVEGAKLTGTHGDVNVIYAFRVPNGTHTTVTLYRGGSLGTEWNHTNAITLDATKNYISGGYTANSAGASWDNLSLNFKKDQRLYLKSNSNWRDASAKLEIYLWDGSHSTWVTFPSKIDDTDYHYITIPDRNWAYGIVVRRESSSSGSSNGWANVWNQTNDIPSNSDATKNCIILNTATITGTVTWETIYYNLTAVRTPTAAANAPTIGLSFTSSNVSVSAANPNTGYHWVNWTSSNGTFGTATNQSTTFTPTASNAVATANYAVNQKIVRFNANGGSGSMSNQTYNYNVAQNLTANSFTKTGYDFDGWATSADGDVEYANSYYLTLTPAANEHGTYLDLYAIWTPNTYSVVFNKNHEDATGTMSNQAFTYAVAQN
ncbi:MAG: InlB B-repeat-containing protein [Paludibacteraceae bacterium]|nr:InlB B-repeat-containing protein [Paludibacteraceae bacterium]